MNFSCLIPLSTAVIKVEIILQNSFIVFKELLVQFYSEKLLVLLLYFERYLNISLYGCIFSERESKVYMGSFYQGRLPKAAL